MNVINLTHIDLNNGELNVANILHISERVHKGGGGIVVETYYILDENSNIINDELNNRLTDNY